MAVTAGELKLCTCCDQVKLFSDFPRDRNQRDGFYPQCKTCKNGKAAGYYKRWTDGQRELHRARVLRTRYGLEYDEVVRIYDDQDGRCAICNEPGLPPASGHGAKVTLHVDHDHESGMVRGLLCNMCNVGLGRFRDNPELVFKAADYLGARLRKD
jgi:hypothetical protein